MKDVTHHAARIGVRDADIACQCGSIETLHVTGATVQRCVRCGRVYRWVCTWLMCDEPEA